VQGDLRDLFLVLRLDRDLSKVRTNVRRLVKRTQRLRFRNPRFIASPMSFDLATVARTRQASPSNGDSPFRPLIALPALRYTLAIKA